MAKDIKGVLSDCCETQHPKPDARKRTSALEDSAKSQITITFFYYFNANILKALYNICAPPSRFQAS